MPKSSKIWLETLKTEYKVSILFGTDSLEPIRVRYRFCFVDIFYEYCIDTCNCPTLQYTAPDVSAYLKTATVTFYYDRGGG